VEKILFLAHVDESGTSLPKCAYEVLGLAIDLAALTNMALVIGLVGENVDAAAASLANAGASRILAVSGSDFAQPRYATDAAAAEALCRATEANVVLVPATSRFSRILPGVSARLAGQADTHITSVELCDGALTANRWFYRQRIEAIIRREARPWFLLLESGCHAAWSGEPGNAVVEQVVVTLPAEAKRTTITGIRSPKSEAQTIRPDASLLFVAGAGWTKKQPDGKVHGEEAESLILGFLNASKASLGGSKSLVDQSGEQQAVLGFMTHLNQVGQTGSTPRHPKGLSTCCHGEEPHVVGWRFIHERRAINLDPNCGWARGKADVLYVADAFAVMKRVNELLQERSAHLQEHAAAAALV
jgi:electron transfer flavoprotein alpha subunit